MQSRCEATGGRKHGACANFGTAACHPPPDRPGRDVQSGGEADPTTGPAKQKHGGWGAGRWREQPGDPAAGAEGSRGGGAEQGAVCSSCIPSLTRPRAGGTTRRPSPPARPPLLHTHTHTCARTHKYTHTPQTTPPHTTHLDTHTTPHTWARAHTLTYTTYIYRHTRTTPRTPHTDTYTTTHMWACTHKYTHTP